MMDRCWNAIALAVILCCCLLLTGCLRSAVTSTAEQVAGQASEQAGSMPDSSPAGEAHDLAQARLALADAEAALAAAAARVDALEHAAEQARREGQRRLLAWASGLAILAMLVCGALAVFLPVIRRQLLLGVGAGAAVLLLAQAIGLALDWLPLLVAAMILGGLAVGLVYALRALRHSTALADRLKLAALGNDPRAAVDALDGAREEQHRQGVRGLIQATRDLNGRAAVHHGIQADAKKMQEAYR